MSINPNDMPNTKESQTNFMNDLKLCIAEEIIQEQLKEVLIVYPKINTKLIILLCRIAPSLSIQDSANLVNWLADKNNV